MKLIIGNISFLTADEDDIKEYTDKERFAIVNSVECIVECKDENEAGLLGEEAIDMGYDSYLVPEEYLKSGDIQYDCSVDMLPIDVNSFRTAYLNY